MFTEDLFTKPSYWQPHPQWWHAADGDATEVEVSHLVAAFIGAMQPELVVETGTNTGQTAWVIGQALAANGHGELWTLEIDPRLAAQATQLCLGLPVHVVCTDSRTWDPPGPIDFAWIDSGPTGDDTAAYTANETIRAEEITRWLSLFSQGAIIGVHDTAPHHPTMGTLLPLLEHGELTAITLRTPRGVTFIQVVND